MRSTRRVIGGLVITACATLAAQQVPARSTASGVYTEAQAAAGETIYVEKCASCHGADLAGNLVRRGAEIEPVAWQRTRQIGKDADGFRLEGRLQEQRAGRKCFQGLGRRRRSSRCPQRGHYRDSWASLVPTLRVHVAQLESGCAIGR